MKLSKLGILVAASLAVFYAGSALSCPVAGNCVKEFSDPPQKKEKQPKPDTKECQFNNFIPAWYGKTASEQCTAENIVRKGTVPAGYEITRGDRTAPRTGYIILVCKQGRLQLVESICK